MAANAANGEPAIQVRDEDVLHGRGGLTNRHPGNKWYRGRILRNRPIYRTLARKGKTALSRSIVTEVHRRNGRFLQRDNATGRYHEISMQEARKKTSQALREKKNFKWTVEDDDVDPLQELEALILPSSTDPTNQDLQGFLPGLPSLTDEDMEVLYDLL